LSKKRINGHLDKTTEEYFNYVTDGVDRMQKLLDDLLQYSRMGKSKDDIKDVDLNAIVFIVIHNMMATMKDSQAIITINHLPIVEGANSEMMQLFQNLIANSIKFRKPSIVPEIKITSSDEGDNYLISLNDNGIGIKKEFQERVFAIFERAHARHEYDGSGIGLATCKKIIESSGGKIWLRSNEGEGTTFYLSFPKPNLN
jgi:light-regulated signal transduction histidine kinase (bacteriophytochrome)